MTSTVLPGAKRKPPSAGIGRVKGVPNKVTREIKQMVLDALDQAGGVDYLEARAKDPRTASAFLGLVGKVLPLQIAGDPQNPIVHAVVRTIVDPNQQAIEK